MHRCRRFAAQVAADGVDKLTLKLLPELRNANRLITTATVSELMLRDPEFVEVHHDDRITPATIEEVPQSPDEVALALIVICRNLFLPCIAAWSLW